MLIFFSKHILRLSLCSAQQKFSLSEQREEWRDTSKRCIINASNKWLRKDRGVCVCGRGEREREAKKKKERERNGSTIAKCENIQRVCCVSNRVSRGENIGFAFQREKQEWVLFPGVRQRVCVSYLSLCRRRHLNLAELHSLIQRYILIHLQRQKTWEITWI